MKNDDGNSKPVSLAIALAKLKARKADTANSKEVHAAEFAAMIATNDALKAELNALSFDERREVLRHAGMGHVSAAPKPIEPVRSAGYVPRAKAQPARWQVWSLIPSAELWKAVALSLNIEPTDSLAADAKRRQDQYSRLPSDYFDRLMVCRANLSMNGPIRPQGGLYSGMLIDPNCPVLLGDVATFLAMSGLTVPDEMRAMALTVTDKLQVAKRATANAALAAAEATPMQGAPVAAAGALADPEQRNAKDKGWVLKRGALIKKHLHHWPTIERDFRDAAQNKLRIAAKATEHGDWYETAALAWATERGKLNDADGPAPVSSVWNLPGTKHTTKG